MANQAKLFIIGDLQTRCMLDKNLLDDFNVEDLAISGATTTSILPDVINVLKKCGRSFKSYVGIVWLGTNDVLTEDVKGFKINYRDIVRICSKKFDRVILVELPPIPRASALFNSVRECNSYIESFQTHKIKVAKINHLFFSVSPPTPNSVSLEYFEEFMGHARNRRPDGIHLNQDGFILVRDKLKEMLDEFPCH